ncbi:Dihydroxyacetone phosphate acyltransferase [Chionoecetes opilio]|uniref:Dihydroxyacetone phosphate acyltransferase n=1 Tax=Chionoecetes opilio TaxID=41210 RepID=A0A8J4XMH1_CHIOP|nr:Dihydroxyacetone phosphate acyltransferase [Chionoecetes opilio]
MSGKRTVEDFFRVEASSSDVTQERERNISRSSGSVDIPTISRSSSLMSLGSEPEDSRPGSQASDQVDVVIAGGCSISSQELQTIKDKMAALTNYYKLSHVIKSKNAPDTSSKVLGKTIKLRSTLVDTPVVLLPTHRSYADFLLISYIAYHYNLPLPVIAAGMDFMKMAVIGDKLRGSGAFYIRRSFMDNPLYWAVFQEYVQTIVECTGSPLEFFLEGTRSRSGKSLPPKIGLLGCVSEIWLRGRLPDLAIVPISISYDRTLEEKLYAYELLGVPKPPESTSGLLKATSILKESFGDIFIHVGEPVSVRSYLAPRVERHLSTSVPQHLASVTKSELCACESLGYHVLRQIQQGAVTSVWSVVCVQLARFLHGGRWSLPLATLVEEVAWLTGILRRTGAAVALEGTVEEGVVNSLSVHKQLASLEEDNVVSVQRIHQPASHPPITQKRIELSASTVEHAVTHLMLQHYINHAIHLLIRPALVALALRSLHHGAASTTENLKQRFAFLRALFGFDFMFEKDMEGRDFMEGLSVLTWSGEVSVVQEQVQMMQSGSPLLTTLHHLISPFALTYASTAVTLDSQTWEDNSLLVTAIQRQVERSIGSSGLYSALSQDSIRHAIRAFTKIGVVIRTSG